MAPPAIVDAMSVKGADTVGIGAPGSHRFGVRASGQGFGSGLLEFSVADDAFIMKVGQARDLLGGTTGVVPAAERMYSGSPRPAGARPRPHVRSSCGRERSGR